MQITVSGEHHLREITQALIEAFAMIQDEYGIHHTRSVTLYINPTDGKGEDVVARNSLGRVVSKIKLDGPYKAAADHYVPLEPGGRR